MGSTVGAVFRAFFSHRWWADHEHEPEEGKRQRGNWLKHPEDRITIIGAVVNVLLSTLKFAAGIYGRSAAMIADAAHSLSDLASDAVTFWSVRMGRLPPDEDHPYGHGRFEALGSLVIAGMLLGTAWAIGAHSLSQGLAILAGQSAIAQAIAAGAPHAHMHLPPTPGSITLVAAVVSLVAKEVLYRVTAKVGRQLGSSVLMANAYHHRTDALSSVVALVGIAGAMLGAPVLDPLGGLLVSIMVGVAGLEVASDALKQLTDAVDRTMADRIAHIAEETEGVVSHSDVRVRWSGSRAHVDLAVIVDPTISASAANDVVERVRLNIITQMKLMDEVLVRSTPVCAVDKNSDSLPGSPEAGKGKPCPLSVYNRRPRKEVEQDVKDQIITNCDGVTGIEHLTVHFLAYSMAVEVAIKVDDDLTVREARTIAESCREAVVNGVADVELADIHLDLLEESPLSMLASSNASSFTATETQAIPDMDLQGPLRR